MAELEQQLTIFKESANQADVIYSIEKVAGLLQKREYGPQELQHTLEVCNFALQILDKEGITDPDSRKVILIAAAIHDTGRYLEDNNIKHHTEIEQEQLAQFIDPSIRSELITQVVKCVQRHSLSSKDKPESIEEQIVFDADNLTLFTEFGFKRWFFKAEDWGHVKNVQTADEQLRNLFEKGRAGQFLCKKSSQEILEQSFYSTVIYK